MTALTLSLFIGILTFVLIMSIFSLTSRRAKFQNETAVASLLNSYVPDSEVASGNQTQVVKRNLIDAIGDVMISEGYQKRMRNRLVATGKQDMNAYLGAYGKDFDPPGNQARSAWEDDRRKRITGKSSISVKLDNLLVTVDGNRAVAKFRQDYRADALSVSSRKTLDLRRVGERWLIVKETTGR